MNSNVSRFMLGVSICLLIVGESLASLAAKESVQLQVSKPTLSEGEPIAANIINNLSLSIYTEMGKGKTDCSAVILQRWNGKVWEPVFGCALGIPPSPIEILPGNTLPILLNPQSIHMTLGGPSIVAGLYRLRFSYRLAFRSFGRRDPFVVYSPPFRVSQ